MYNNNNFLACASSLLYLVTSAPDPGVEAVTVGIRATGSSP